MSIQRTIPPAAAPIDFKNIFHGLTGIFNGKRHIEKLKEEVIKYFDIKHVFLISSGKAAITLILLALKSLSSKKQVLIPAYTCFSVPSAIVKAGLKVSLCDIGSKVFDFDYKLLQKAINKDTLCVIPNHLFGIPSDIERIKEICKDNDIFIVEDAAQAMGGTYNGKKLGTIGDVGFFSLGRGKNITCGSGGIILTNSDQIANAIAMCYSKLEKPGFLEDIKEYLQVMLMNLFIRPSFYWFPSGLPFLKLGQTTFYKDFPIKKLSGIKAGLLRGWQKRLEKINQIRKENAKYFNERLRLRSRLRLSNGNTQFSSPSPLWGEGRAEGVIPYLRLPVLMKNKEIRDEILSLSNKKGLGLSPMYPTPINEIKELNGAFNGQSFPSAKKAAESLLTIPTHHLLSAKDKERISNLLQ